MEAFMLGGVHSEWMNFSSRLSPLIQMQMDLYHLICYNGGRNSRKLLILFFLSISFFFFFSFINPNISYAADQENCMFCHQYPLLGTVDDNATFKSFYVNEDHYSGSVHQKLSCSECHKGITKIPHEKNLTISCTNECHITEPSLGRKYSHNLIAEELKGSIHNIDNRYVKDKSNPKDFPECVSCHKNTENKLVIASRRNAEYVVIQEAEGKCFDCHTTLNDFAKKNLVHVLRRSEGSYTQQDILAMCVSCHNDKALNERHKMVNAVYSYLENYHGKTMELGLENAPSCIDCHIKLGESPHAIKSSSDPDSSTYLSNRGKTCVRADCHPNASLGMGKSDIHIVATDMSKFPIQFWLLAFFTFLTVGSFVPLMLILILELVRMIFPKFTIMKNKRGNRS